MHCAESSGAHDSIAAIGGPRARRFVFASRDFQVIDRNGRTVFVRGHSPFHAGSHARFSAQPATALPEVTIAELCATQSFDNASK
jgi:hypothetical protein